MYEFITHTWNPILGKCPHDCKYCYVIYKYGEMRNDTLRFDRDCLRDDLVVSEYTIEELKKIKKYIEQAPYNIERVFVKCLND